LFIYFRERELRTVQIRKRTQLKQKLILYGGEGGVTVPCVSITMQIQNYWSSIFEVGMLFNFGIWDHRNMFPRNIPKRK